MVRNTSVMGIYPDRTTVSDAVNVLQKAGYRLTDISVLASDNAGSKDFAHEKHTKAPEGAALAAAAGAVIGAAAGLDRFRADGDHRGIKSARRGWTGAGGFCRRRRRRRGGLDRGMAGRVAPDGVCGQAVRRSNPEWRHSPVRSLRYPGVVCAGEEHPERHGRPEHLLCRGVCRRLWDHR